MPLIDNDQQHITSYEYSILANTPKSPKFAEMSTTRLVEAKQLAEKCMKEGKYTEAFFHWTSVIKLSGSAETNAYYQRAKCFLKQEQHYYALQDAEHLINKLPASAQGYSRKADVMFETENYPEALALYQRCFQLSHNDKEYFMELSKRCKKEIIRQQQMDAQYPYVGAAIGIVVASLGVIADAFVHKEESFIYHPILKVFVVLVVSSSCYLFAFHFRKYVKSSKAYLLEPPVDLFGSRRGGGGSQRDPLAHPHEE